MSSLMDQLRPTYLARNVELLTPDLFEQGGLLERVDGIGFDVDGTLMSHHASELSKPVSDMLHELGDTGIAMSVISNAYDDRVDELKEIFEEDFDMRVITPVDVADGENPKHFRKPSPDMLQLAMEELGPHDEYLMVGDQMLKDVVSANRADVLSLLVPRRGEGDDWRVRAFQRPAEYILRHCVDLPSCRCNFPKSVTPIGCVHPISSMTLMHKALIDLEYDNL